MTSMVGRSEGWYSSLEKLHKRLKKTVGSEPPSQVVDSGISWLCARHLLSVVLANKYLCDVFLFVGELCLCWGPMVPRWYVVIIVVCAGARLIIMISSCAWQQCSSNAITYTYFNTKWSRVQIMNLDDWWSSGGLWRMTGAGSGERSLELAGNQKTISMNITLGENNKGIRAICNRTILCMGPSSNWLSIWICVSFPGQLQHKLCNW